MHEYAYILARSVHQCIKIRKLLSAHMECRMVPVPRYLSSDCGSCVRVNAADSATAANLIEAAGITPEGIKAQED